MPSCSPFCQRYWSSAKTATYLACVHPAPTTDSFRGEGYDIDVNGSEALFAIVHWDDKNGIFPCAIACESCGYRSCNRRMWWRLDVREGHRCDACKAELHSNGIDTVLKFAASATDEADLKKMLRDSFAIDPTTSLAMRALAAGVVVAWKTAVTRLEHQAEAEATKEVRDVAKPIPSANYIQGRVMAAAGYNFGAVLTHSYKDRASSQGKEGNTKKPKEASSRTPEGSPICFRYNAKGCAE
ncbi:unnamed protein product [Symbiodinium necroappetens]|uniref:Uncharacterized protein n=1 Tax=Symbiodinium necroappetens TaxID=1628268 RepID=A0A812PG42_9DINO|nr:unnamed protein product [Symbiodinium necroappetens]